MSIISLTVSTTLHPPREGEVGKGRSGSSSSDVTTRYHQDVTPWLYTHNAEDKDSEEQQVAVQKVATLNVKQSKIQELIAHHSPASIQEKRDLLRWKRKHGVRGTPITDSAAWVVKAIEDDYAPPPEFVAWQAKQQKKGVQSKQISQWEKEKQQEAAQAERAYQQALKKLQSVYGTATKEQRQWDQARLQIKEAIGFSTYSFWFPNTHLLAIQDGMVTKKRLEGQHAPLIVQALSAMGDSNQDTKVQAMVPSPD